MRQSFIVGRSRSNKGQVLQIRRLAFYFGVAALSLVPAFGAQAFEIFGIKLFEDQSEIDADSVIADPQPYTVTIETPVAPADIAGVISGASALVQDAAAPASGAAGLLAKARSDYRRITAALYEQGYYGGVISILVGGREAANLPPDVTLPKPVAVAITVNAGPLFHFGRLVVDRTAPPNYDPNDEVPLPYTAGFEAGAVARSGAILRAEKLAIESWRQQGFAKAALVSSQVVADHDTNLVDVTITVEPGRRAAFGETTVTGTEHMDPAFVARQAGLPEGEEYDPDDLARANKRLSRLEVFRSLRLQEAQSIRPDGLLPIDIIVQELPLNRVGLGATLSTIDGAGVEGFWLHRNLFGHAERLRLDAKVSSIAFPINTAEFDYAFGGTFTMPGFVTPDTDLVAAIAAERSVYDTYTETSATARLGITQYFSDQLTFDAGAFYKRSFFEDDFGERHFSMAGLTGGVTWDDRDDPLNATRGIYANLTAQPFYEFYYGNPGFRTTAEARTYFSFSEDDFLVLAGRLKVGALLGPDLDEIPPDQLFFAGGGGSVRGYPYKSIGVDGPGGTVTGGRYLLEGSLEARLRFANDFGAVAFIDGGYVAADSFPGIDQLRLGAGVGLRYFTGLGPLRLDVAVPLNKRATDPDYALYLGIGQAF